MSWDENRERENRDDRWESLGDRTADRAEGFALRSAEQFERKPKRTAAKWVGIFVAVILVISVVGGVIGWFGDWGNEAVEKTKPKHAGPQVTAVLDDEKSMVASASNVCDIIKASDDDEKSPDDPVIVGGNASFQYRAQYRSIKADYDRRMANFFEANVTRHVPIPGGIRQLPKTAPTLEERMAELCPEVK